MRNPVSLVLKLALASLLVGLALSFFGISPSDLLQNIGGTALRIYEASVRSLAWAAEYILIGAVVVVPIWLIVWLLGRLGGKRD